MFGFSRHRRSSVRDLLLRFWRNQSGAQVVIFALWAPLFLWVATGLAADGGLDKNPATQIVARSGAPGAASAWAPANANLKLQAWAVAASYGFVPR
jgi:hypothetical protein